MGLRAGTGAVDIRIERKVEAENLPRLIRYGANLGDNPHWQRVALQLAHYRAAIVNSLPSTPAFLLKSAANCFADFTLN
jgi:hypothetical protein